MGFYDRDYYRTPPRANRGGGGDGGGGGGGGGTGNWSGDVFQRPTLGSVTTWLILLNIIVYVVDRLLEPHWAAIHHLPRNSPLGGPLGFWGYFSIDTAIAHAQAWRVFTCQFLHVGFWHLAMNMLGLWIFGGLVERRLGRRRYSFYYLLCGMAGPVMYTALWTLGLLTPAHFLPTTTTPLVGASAAIFGVMLAAAYLEPDRPLDLYIGEITLKYFAWIMVGVAAYTVMIHGPNAGGQAAHLGGALLGYVLIRHDSALNLVAKRSRVKSRKEPSANGPNGNNR